MRALVYTAPGELQVLDVDRPAAAEGDVLVEVAAAGICGSELEGFSSRSPFRVPPLIMGHEFAGRRSDTGERVAVNPLVTCGGCDLCRRGQPNVCRHRVILGIQRPGGFSDIVAVPAANCVALPDGVTMVQGAFVEPLANAVHALGLIRAHQPNPDRVGVIGAGPLGFAVITVAVHSGIPQVAAADTFAPRRVWAENTGADCADRLTGEFDAVVDTVGTAATRAESVDLVRPGGIAVWMGLHGPGNDVDGQGLIRTEKRITGSFCYTPGEFEHAVGVAATLDTGWARPVPLDAAAAAFYELLDRPAETLKTVVIPTA